MPFTSKNAIAKTALEIHAKIKKTLPPLKLLAANVWLEKGFRFRFFYLRCYCVFGFFLLFAVIVFGEDWTICAVCVFVWFNVVDGKCSCYSNNTIP